MVTLVKPPYNLDKSTIIRVEQSFFEAIESAGKAEHNYVHRRIDRILKSLLNSASDWEVGLAINALAVYKTYSKFHIFGVNCNQSFYDPSSDFCLECGGHRDTVIFYSECIERAIFWQRHDSNCLQTRLYASKVALTALHYLCNPFNVIPDHEVGIGYVDDAYVINKCLLYFKKEHPKLLNHAKSK